MQAFEISQLLAECSQSGRAYLEFLRHPSLSAGIYTLPAGAVDPQEPHTEDEVYYILKGKGSIQVEDESRPVTSGSVVFVKALAEHRFHSIAEDLSILVFFAPAEYTNVLPSASKS